MGPMPPCFGIIATKIRAVPCDARFSTKLLHLVRPAGWDGLSSSWKSFSPKTAKGRALTMLVVGRDVLWSPGGRVFQFRHTTAAEPSQGTEAAALGSSGNSNLQFTKPRRGPYEGLALFSYPPLSQDHTGWRQQQWARQNLTPQQNCVDQQGTLQQKLSLRCYCQGPRVSFQAPLLGRKLLHSSVKASFQEKALLLPMAPGPIRAAACRPQVDQRASVRVSRSTGCGARLPPWGAAQVAQVPYPGTCSSTGPLRQGRILGMPWGATWQAERLRSGATCTLLICRSSWTLASKAGKGKTVYVCSDCGDHFPNWFGWCQGCKAQGTLQKMHIPKDDGGGGAGVLLTRRMPAGGWTAGTRSPVPRRLVDISTEEDKNWRVTLEGKGGQEICQVLGGGVVRGSLTLVGGEPGAGKSTLLLQVAALLAEQALTGQAAQGEEEEEEPLVLYVSAEETEQQVANRGHRMGLKVPNLMLMSTSDLEEILELLHKLQPAALIVDSIQTVYLSSASGSMGSVSQVRECATALLRTAKSTGVPIFIVGHVTKSGDIAGPKVLEHIVDVVLYMEGESLAAHRILRSTKNRFGDANELAVFEMAPTGLEAVPNPSQVFLRDRAHSPRGSAGVAVVMQGSRPLLVEVQALCMEGGDFGGKRFVNGVEQQRLSLLQTVVQKLLGKKGRLDISVNVVGGLQVKEPGADLAIAMAILSSCTNRSIPTDVAFVGEVGLGGELRHVPHMDRRVLEAAKLGFKHCVVPPGGRPIPQATGLAVHCQSLWEAWQFCMVLSQEEQEHVNNEQKHIMEEQKQIMDEQDQSQEELADSSVWA